MLVKASNAELKHFPKPDEVRTFPKGKLELVHTCTYWRSRDRSGYIRAGLEVVDLLAASGEDKEL